MIEINFSEVDFVNLITHHIGNKMKEEPIICSEDFTILKAESKNYLMEYFFKPFKTDELFSFDLSDKVMANEVYGNAKAIFNNIELFKANSKNIAHLLYENSTHPKIKSGELCVAAFSNILFDGKYVDALGIFKAENLNPFLKIMQQSNRYLIDHDFGYAVSKIDKACLIINSNEEDGYDVLAYDSVNAEDAQFWKEAFLRLKNVNNAFFQTKTLMNLTKDFIETKVADAFELERTDQIDLLNKSAAYFKNADTFDKQEFEQIVFNHEDQINSFRKFEDSFSDFNNVEIEPNFEISNQAVKKYNKIFKSVLKLDKNFHVYIHGDRDRIEKGVDENGKKFYKLFYDVEE